LDAEKDRPCKIPSTTSRRSDPELVEAREKALKAEKDRKTF
jgi:hypothetical protein